MTAVKKKKTVVLYLTEHILLMKMKKKKKEKERDGNYLHVQSYLPVRHL